MNDILKQRLVGALVLIALGVALWPVIFVETDRVTMDPSPQVKPMPELEDVDIPAPEPLADVESVAVVETMRLEADAQDAVASGEGSAGAAEEEPGGGAKAAPESPALDERGIPVAWVLQVASVSSRERADRLTGELIASGYKAYHRPVSRDDEVLHRVFVGPVFEREKLALAKRNIDEEFNVNAIIARYVP